MYKFIGVLAGLVVAPASAHAVTWTFFETACTVFGGGAPCHFPDAPPPPVVLATLSLPGPTSSGSADWELFTTPVYTGDSFEFGFVGGSVTPAFTGTPNCESFPFIINSLCEFHIAWSEVDGHLDAISIYVLGAENQIGAVGRPFGLNGGIIASDFVIGSCELTQCIATGFWQSNLVPEPGSAALLASALLSLWMTRRPRRAAAGGRRAAPLSLVCEGRCCRLSDPGRRPPRCAHRDPPPCAHSAKPSQEAPAAPPENGIPQPVSAACAP